MGGRAEKGTRSRKLITKWTLSGAYQFNDYEFVKLKYPRPRREKYSKMGREISWRGGLRTESDLSFSDYHFHGITCTDFKKEAKDFLSLYWALDTRSLCMVDCSLPRSGPHTPSTVLSIWREDKHPHGKYLQLSAYFSQSHSIRHLDIPAPERENPRLWKGCIWCYGKKKKKKKNHELKKFTLEDWYCFCK